MNQTKYPLGLSLAKHVLSGCGKQPTEGPTRHGRLA